MTREEFIDKWLVGYESREQKEEFAIEMMADLASLQSKGKTKEEVRQILNDFTPKVYEFLLKPPFHMGHTQHAIACEKFADIRNQFVEEYAQSHASQDGWVSVDDLQKALKMQIEECAVFAQRCARDKGMASIEYDQWIKETPILDLTPQP